MSTNESEPKQKKFYTSQDVTRIFGISRHQLIYWTDKAGLIEPYQRLHKANLYDFRNLLNIGLIKTFVEFGISSSVIIEWFKKINEWGDLWQWVKDWGEKGPPPYFFFLSIGMVTPKEGAFKIVVSKHIYEKEAHKLPEIDRKELLIKSQCIRRIDEASYFIVSGDLSVRLDPLIEQIEKLSGEKL